MPADPRRRPPCRKEPRVGHEIDPTLLVRHLYGSGQWESPEMSAYDNEDHLQSILAEAPEHVPGVLAGAHAVRELPTSAGPADVCIVGLEGDITIVECKLASNSERRRMVVGQILDYASAIWRDGEQAFRQQWARQGGDDLSVLGASAEATVAERERRANPPVSRGGSHRRRSTSAR